MTMAFLVIAAIATSETALGSGPFAQSSPFENSPLLQIYLAGIGGLPIACQPLLANRLICGLAAFVAIQFEERDLIRVHGISHENYRIF